MLDKSRCLRLDVGINVRVLQVWYASCSTFALIVLASSLVEREAGWLGEVNWSNSVHIPYNSFSSWQVEAQTPAPMKALYSSMREAACLVSISESAPWDPWLTHLEITSTWWSEQAKIEWLLHNTRSFFKQGSRTWEERSWVTLGFYWPVVIGRSWGGW